MTKTKKDSTIKRVQIQFMLFYRHIRTIRRRYIAIGGLGVAICFSVVILWPQQVLFSYQEATCFNHPIIAPDLLKTNFGDFEAKPTSELKIGSIVVAASAVCVEPLATPIPGDYNVSLSVFGMPFIAKTVTIHVPSYPVASIKKVSQPVPTGKNFVVPLSGIDRIFSYRLAIGDENINCINDSIGVNCDIKKLNLKQNSEYLLRLDRYFKDKKVSTVFEDTIITLAAVTLLTSSIKQDELVFAKPTSMTLQFDKPINTLNPVLMKVIGDKKEKISTKTIISDKEATVTWSDDLSRQQTYELDLGDVEAIDGSSLADKEVIAFKTSGGPMVKSINIGTYKVSMGAVAIITFDQPLSEKQDIGKIITATGGAKILKREGRYVTVSFVGTPRCGDVTIRVTDELMSNYDIAGGSAWQYTTRTVCQLVGSIGTSVKGRAIASYSFGSGPKTIVYTGAIHGDEVSTRSLMLRWIEVLEANVRSIPADRTIIVIPTINPDGFAAGSRTNAHNVDLNRNFDTADWRQDITTVTNQPFPGGGGSAPLSEPESLALANFIGNRHPALVLSYHSIGGLVVSNQFGNSVALSQRYAGLSGYGNATGSSGTFDYTVSGTADDYYGEKLGVASILIELGSHTDAQFDRNQRAMWAVLREV
jgi:predicted deacylase